MDMFCPDCESLVKRESPPGEDYVEEYCSATDCDYQEERDPDTITDLEPSSIHDLLEED